MKLSNDESVKLANIIKNLKVENKLKTNKLARILRHMTVYDLNGQKDVPIKEILEIITDDKIV